MIESCFYDGSQVGRPTFMADTLFQDVEKLWLPNEYAGGLLRWGGEEFPIVSNTADLLTVVGDPSAVEPVEPFCYQLVPASVAGLTQLLTTEKFTVLTSYAQIPTNMYCFTIRLERDQQGDAYIGDSLKHYADDGIEYDIRQQTLTGSYLLSIWGPNREGVLWLYSWLMTYGLQSMAMFSSWGLYDVAFAGSDLDPALQYLAERTYTRHLLLTATRMERAVTTREVEWVSGFCIRVIAHYARLDATIMPAMD